MLNSKLLFVILIGSFIFNGCTYKNDILRKQIGSYRNYIDITGTIKNGIYTSPNNKFSYKVPSLLKPGARIKDYINNNYNGGVSFTDDTGKLIRVEYVNKTLIPLKNDEEKVRSCGNFLYNSMYKQTGFDIKLFHSEIIDNKLFVIFDFPNGSTLFINNKRTNAIRGSVCFIKNDNLFIITKQSNESFLTGSEYNDIPKMIKRLKIDLDNFK